MTFSFKKAVYFLMFLFLLQLVFQKSLENPPKTSNEALFFPHGSKRSSPPQNLLLDISNTSRYRFAAELCSTWSSPSNGSLNCDLEWDEWMLADVFVQPGDVVLELGARFGTTSCILSRKVGVEGHVISVEPDAAIFPFLQQNNAEHNCGLSLLRGTVSQTPQYFHKPGQGPQAGYAYFTSSTPTGEQERPLPSMTYHGLLQKTDGRKPNVALLDCEGCLGTVDPMVLETVDLLLLEEDQNKLINYTDWHLQLHERYGFECKWYLLDSSPWGWISMQLKHSAWIKRGKREQHLTPSCREYGLSRGLQLPKNSSRAKKSQKEHPFLCIPCPAPGQVRSVEEEMQELLRLGEG